MPNTPPTLAIWEDVQETDPNYTKTFKRGGGFSGTAVSGTYLAKRATEKFGPIGHGWGLAIEQEEYRDGAPLLDSGQVIGHEIIHVLLVRLWYRFDGKVCDVFQFGQTTFVGKNKYGFFTDEEAPKKSLTDAMTKCLSLLGFASDIHLGLYDDNGYVNDLREKYSGDEKPKSKPNDKPNDKPPPHSRVWAAAVETYDPEAARNKDVKPNWDQVGNQLKTMMEGLGISYGKLRSKETTNDEADRICTALKVERGSK